MPEEEEEEPEEPLQMPEEEEELWLPVRLSLGFRGFRASLGIYAGLGSMTDSIRV